MKKIIPVMFYTLVMAYYAQSQGAIIGTATPNSNWTSSFTMNASPYDVNEFVLPIFLTEGQIKFIVYPAADTIGGDNFPQGIGVMDGPAINIPESGFYNITLDTSTLVYAFNLGRVGINTETPWTALDVAGGISSRSVLHYVDNDTVIVPNNVNHFILAGGLSIYDTMDVILPNTSFIDGLRLIITNGCDQMVRINVEYDYIYIPVGSSAEFLILYWDGWHHLSSSESAIGSNTWQTLGNTGTNSSTHFIGTTDATDLTIKTSDSPRIQISADGNVGIGDLYQPYQLVRARSTLLSTTGYFLNTNAELEGNMNSYSVRGDNFSKTNGTNYGGYFKADGYSEFSSGNNIGVAAIGFNGSNQSIGLLARGTDLSAHFDIGKVLIDERLGIGTLPSDNTKLQVLLPENENIAARFVFPLDGNDNEVSIGKKLGGDFLGLYIDVEDTYDSIAIWAKGKAFILNDLSVGGSYVPAGYTMAVDGKVIILNELGVGGALVPAGYTMAVDGKVIAEEVRVQNSSAWPDYVFAADYPLRPIQDVAAFIGSHKHLPDVPPASQIEADGIMLGEMQTTLLKKIEELTLYIIDQQKQINALNQKLALLTGDK